MFKNISSVKRTDVGESGIGLGSNTLYFSRTPECKLTNSICGLKTPPFSCTGGIL